MKTGLTLISLILTLTSFLIGQDSTDFNSHPLIIVYNHKIIGTWVCSSYTYNNGEISATLKCIDTLIVRQNRTYTWLHCARTDEGTWKIEPQWPGFYKEGDTVKDGTIRFSKVNGESGGALPILNITQNKVAFRTYAFVDRSTFNNPRISNYKRIRQETKDSTTIQELFVIHIRENWLIFNDTCDFGEEGARKVSKLHSSLKLSRKAQLTIFDPHGNIIFDKKIRKFDFSQVARNIYYFRFESDQDKTLMFRVY